MSAHSTVLVDGHTLLVFGGSDNLNGPAGYVPVPPASACDAPPPPVPRDAMESPPPPPLPGQGPSLCPAAVPLTPSAGLNGICNRQ